MADAGRDSESVSGTEAGSDASAVGAGDAADTEAASHARGASGTDRVCWVVGDMCEAFYKDGLWVPAKVLGSTKGGKKVGVRYDKPEPPVDCRSIHYPMKDESLGTIADRFGVQVELLVEANRGLNTGRHGATALRKVQIYKLTEITIPHVHRVRAGQTPQVAAPRASQYPPASPLGSVSLCLAGRRGAVHAGERRRR